MGNKKFVEGLERYSDSHGPDQCVDITEIIVPTQYDKDQLIKAFKYLHDLRTVDTVYLAVNTLAHFYNVADRIVVRP
jgi:hypothetical protein